MSKNVDHVYKNVNQAFAKQCWTSIWKMLIKHMQNVKCVYINVGHVLKNDVFYWSCI